MVQFFISFLYFYEPCRDLGGRIGEVNGCEDPYGDPAMAEGVVCSTGQEEGEGWKGKWWYPDAVEFAVQMSTSLSYRSV